MDDVELYYFGSFATELYLPGSDIDCVIIHKELTLKKLLRKTKKIIKENPELFKDI